MLLKILTLHGTARTILPLRVEVFRGCGRVLLLIARFVGLRRCLAVWMLLLVARFVRLGRGLAVWVLLLVTLRALLCLLLVLRGVHVAPAAIAVRLLPARSGVLVYVAVVAGVHVAIRALARGCIPIGRTGAYGLSACVCLSRRYGPL